MSHAPLAVQCHLREGGTLDELLVNFAIKAKRHPVPYQLTHRAIARCAARYRLCNRCVPA